MAKLVYNPLPAISLLISKIFVGPLQMSPKVLALGAMLLVLLNFIVKLSEYNDACNSICEI